MNHSQFSIFNASAGSGKTFTLVKAYLVILLSSNKPDYFKHILAITFTNKAVGEMKQRIMESLIAFSNSPVSKNHQTLFNMVCKETKLSENELTTRAKKAVHFILHHYSFFDVETIDRFNHRLIRTFAKDLKLSSNFEVELDVNSIMNEAIDQVISRVGVDEELTKLILEFSFEKADEDKSWDITTDLQKISKILYSENDLKHFEKLKNKSLNDFINLKKSFDVEKSEIEAKLKQLTKQFFEILSNNQLEDSDFNGKYFPKYFHKISNNNFNVLTGAGWQQDFGTSPLYPKRVSAETAAAIDALTPRFVELFEQSSILIVNLNFINLLSQSVNALSLINAIYTEYLFIQAEKNILPISEFNTRISNEIKNQPAPFIYERLGEKYLHYFIDEFQDTSQLQWNNLIPLIENALSQTNEMYTPGSLLLVGDAKQSIYRWRGGDPDQFIQLYEKHNPFLASKKIVETLGTNFRSYDEVIQLNNSFFSYVSKSLTSNSHSDLYAEGNAQNITGKSGGFVSFTFLDPKSEEDKNTVYQEKTLEIINHLIAQEYALKDISILVRTNSQGVALAEFLSKNNLKVISSEALLLESAPEIVFILNLLKIIQNFDDKKARADVFYFLHSHLEIQEELSGFILEMLACSKEQVTQKLKFYNLDFNLNFSSGIPLYDLCENICNVFMLSKSRVAYVQSFLELAFEFSNKETNTISSFLEFWESKKSKSSVEISEQVNAVTIMTVHKSKGLEFPVVIYPYADDELVSVRNEKLWFPLNENTYSGFSEMLVPVKRELESFGETGRLLYEEFKMKSELDSLNIVYVAMTRAIEQLFVLTNINSIDNENRTASLFHNYLVAREKWNTSKSEYHFGSPERPSEKETEVSGMISLPFDSFPKSVSYTNIIKIATKKALLWNTEKEKAIEKGDLLHDVLAEVITANDLDNATEKFHSSGTISSHQAKEVSLVLKAMIAHPQLSVYFQPEASAVNEKEIFTKSGQSLRPDRINFLNENVVAIIDYKTGLESPEHFKQIKEYAGVMEEMGFKINELLIVYIREQIDVVVVDWAS